MSFFGEAGTCLVVAEGIRITAAAAAGTAEEAYAHVLS